MSAAPVTEEGVETVLHRAVGDGDDDMSLAATWFAQEDQATSFSDEVWGKTRAEERETERERA